MSDKIQVDGKTEGNVGKRADAPIRECTGCKAEVATNLSCPTCLKLGLGTSYFCTDQCFRQNWATHKNVHLIMEKALVASEGAAPLNTKRGNGAAAPGRSVLSSLDKNNYNPADRVAWRLDSHLVRFVDFEFTGPLRPWPVSPPRAVPETIVGPDYSYDSNYGTPTSEIKSKSRKDTSIDIQTPEQIKRLRESCLLARKALDVAHTLCKVGNTTDTIDEEVHKFIIDEGGYPSPLNYYKFPKSCCTSVNEVICHGIPDFRPLEEGDIVNVDITVYYKGIHGDINETFIVGATDEKSEQLVQCAYECLMESIQSCCKPGKLYRQIGPTVSAIAEKHGFSVVKTYCGHGIGELFHTTPNVPHYKKNKAIGVMKPGHTFTIEPMINMGKYQDVLWPDQWTAVTADGKKSAQFEHTLLITENGVDVLTKRLPTSPKLEIDTKTYDHA